MKKLITPLLFIVGFTTGIAQETYLEKLVADSVSVERTTGENVAVSMKLDFTHVPVQSMNSMRVVPVLVSADGTQRTDLPPIVLDGKVRHRIHKRVEKLDKVTLNSDAWTTLRKKSGEEQVVDYRVEVPLESWMWGGRLQLNAFVTGCRACAEGDEQQTLAEGLLPTKQLTLSRSLGVVPEEIIKRRSESHTARLRFRVGSSVIDPSFGNNRAEIDSILHSINVVHSNPDVTITGLYITGYASPEGGFASNMALSERRARALAQYVGRQYTTLHDTLYHVDWRGEDWDYLRAEVVKYTDWEAAPKVLEIIDHCEADKDVCEWRLQQLGAAVYTRLKNEIYEKIRRNEYRIEYKVRGFDVKESWQILHTHPELMSVYEIQQVAATFERGSEEELECWTIAVKTFPDHVVARNNAAILLNESGRTDEALQLLENATDGMLLNVAATIYAERKELDRAEELLVKAVEAGSKEAEANLKQLKEYREYMVE